MATFQIGQRVRLIDPSDDFCGRQGTITNYGRCNVSHYEGVHRLWDHGLVWCYGVNVDGIGTHDPADGLEFGYQAYQLAPLTDSGVDAFLEAIRKLKPLHEEPKVERQFVHSQGGV